LTTNLLLLFIIHSIYNRKILFQPLNQYKLLDLLVKNLILYSNYLTNQTQILSIQRIYDQRQSLNNRMNIGSINLSSQYFSKPIDHHTIDLQQISVYSYYAYDQQMIIEQTIINYINNNNYTFIEYFKQLKICSLSVEFLNEILINEYFLKSIEELNQQIQYIINKTSNYLLIYHGLDYLIKISKYSNVQIWFSKTIIASNIWKYLLDIFNNPNISSFIQSPSILLTQLITLLRNLSIQCPTNQINMSLISTYLAYLTEQRLEQDRPLTGYLQYILSEVVLKHEYIQCLINTRDYPINIREYYTLFQRNSLYHKLIQDCSISMNIGQLIEKLFGFNYLQANIWTATNYIKNKSYLIKASSEPINNNHRRKIPRAELVSLRSTIQSKLTTKSISSLTNLTKHQ
ncbi:unnamed protein product, partial [Rotaria sordida]